MVERSLLTVLQFCNQYHITERSYITSFRVFQTQTLLLQNKNVHDHATHITSVKPISQKWVENNIIHVAILRTCNNEKLQFFLKQILANCSNKLQPESIPQTCRQRIKGYIIVNQRLLHLKVIVKNRSRQEHVYTDIMSIYLNNFEKIFTLDYIDNENYSNI